MCTQVQSFLVTQQVNSHLCENLTGPRTTFQDDLFCINANEKSTKNTSWQTGGSKGNDAMISSGSNCEPANQRFVALASSLPIKYEDLFLLYVFFFPPSSRRLNLAEEEEEKIPACAVQPEPVMQIRKSGFAFIIGALSAH